ncbi:hypothetical protein [Streptomyces sp. NPDC054874]
MPDSLVPAVVIVVEIDGLRIARLLGLGGAQGGAGVYFRIWSYCW